MMKLRFINIHEYDPAIARQIPGKKILKSIVLIFPVIQAFWCASAYAQAAQNSSAQFFRASTLVSPSVPVDYDRGGNVSIEGKPRPEYDALPVHIGSIDIYPVLENYVGFSSNVLLRRSDPKSDLLVGSSISVFASGDFGSSKFALYAKDWENVWTHNAVRSQDQGNIDATYQFDVSDQIGIALESSFIRYGDNNAVGVVNNLSDILLTTQQTMVDARMQYLSGNFRQTISIDRQHFNLDPVYSELTGLEQNYYDDHTFVRITSQSEYMLSRSLGFFVQGSAYKTTYSSLLPGNLPNYGSSSYRLVAGASLDIRGYLRGQFSIGLGHRDYESDRYHTPTGFVTAANIYVFLDPEDNISFTVLKDFDDGSVYSLSAVKYLSANVAYEREVRENVLGGFKINRLILYPLVEGGAQAALSNYGGEVYLKYMVNHHVNLKFEIGAERDNTNGAAGYTPDFASNTEVRGLFTIGFTP